MALARVRKVKPRHPALDDDGAAASGGSAGEESRVGAIPTESRGLLGSVAGNRVSVKDRDRAWVAWVASLARNLLERLSGARARERGWRASGVAENMYNTVTWRRN